MSAENVVTNDEIDSFIKDNWDSFISDAQALISIDSSYDPDHAEQNAPFGPGPRKALDEALSIAKRMGFAVQDCEGYAGIAEVPGESGQQVGVIGHLDVVPAGEGWHVPPFALTQKEGVLLGRGTADDKVPLLCALYACKFWMDRNVSLRHSVRFIFGCNEETGMADLPYYLAHHKAPDFLFTPDADFPLCYGEKGLFGVTLSYEMPDQGQEASNQETLGEERSVSAYHSPSQLVVSFEGGTATNAVPARAKAVVRLNPKALPEADRITVEACQEGSLVTATGISGHASTPEGTINAIGLLANYLAGLEQCSAEERQWFSFVAANLAGRTDGSPMGIAASDEDFGALTSIVGTMRKVENRYEVTIDIRFPRAITGEKLSEAFEKLANHLGATLTITRNQEPFVINPETEPVQALMSAYKQTTNLEVQPFTMGGATYAREFPRAVSFGPADPKVIKKPDWVGEMHGADEGITEEAVKHAIRIYVRAFGNLSQVESLS